MATPDRITTPERQVEDVAAALADRGEGATLDALVRLALRKAAK